MMTKELGFELSKVEPGAFYKHDFERNEHVSIAVNVDDMDIIANTDHVADRFVEDVSKHFKITDLGETHYPLGFEVKRDRAAHTISLNQGSYIDTIANRFNLINTKPIYTPMEPGAVLTKEQCPKTPREYERMQNIPYRSALGAAWYAATVTRPNVTFALSLLSQFAQNPAKVHWRALQRVIVYLKTTRDHWLVLGGKLDGNSTGGWTGYTDSDWASQPHRHSISAYIYLAGRAISWSSKKQSIIALSSTEAEYIAQTNTAREAVWLRTYWADLTGKPLTSPSRLFSDNQGAIALAKSGSYHARTKHIDIRFHFIHETIENQLISLSYCPTEDMVADILTKALPRQQFEKLHSLLGVHTA